MSNEIFYNCWKRFVTDKKEIDSDLIRPIILESWKRSKAYGVDPYRTGCVSVSTEELEHIKNVHSDLLETALPYLQKLYNLIKGSGSLITLTDENAVVLDVFSDDDIQSMQNFPNPGTIHAEKIIGTSGIGTTLFTDKPLQIHAEEHWIKGNHKWACNSSTIHSNGKIIGCFNLSCPSSNTHVYSLGLIVASVNAIERELDLKSALKEKQRLVKQQNAVLELVDTGIILINKQGIILQTNKMVHDIFNIYSSLDGHHISELIHENIDFISLINNEVSLNDREISLKLKGKHTYLRVSTAFIKNEKSIEALVIKIHKEKAILKMVNRIAGSRAIYTFKNIIGKSPKLLKCIKLVEMANRTNANVLIMGQSGTGKELFAQAIHNDSSRKKGPFVAINCGALSRNLIQSELFGYEGGAFTGAKKEGNPGKFELADGGTLFLDEIGELPLEAQVNLLRVLQTGEVIRIGAKYAKSIDVRIIASTNKDLYLSLQEKTFRNDLFYRINIFICKLPALRERPEDIRILADIFLKRFSQDMLNKFQGIQEKVYEIFENYNWPGNIRELENVIDRAIAVADTSWITMSDLPSYLQSTHTNLVEHVPALYDKKKEQGIREIEYECLLDLLKRNYGNIREVARKMGVARSTVYNKIIKYKIHVDNFRVY